LARRFYQMCMGLQAEGLATADLTALQYGVLGYLNRQGGEPGIDQNSLAARLGVERSHASLLVEELAAKGLVERRVDGADRRVRLLSLTPKGERLYGRVHPGVHAANLRVLEPLSTREREQFMDMLVRMIGANGAHARPGAGRRKRKERRPSPDDERKPGKPTNRIRRE
jgi:DNA-binding MarR family transcriptional regulator